MTFENIVERVMNRLNLLSTTAESRVQDTINDVYKDVTSAIGLDTSRRETANYTINSTSVNYPILPQIQLEGMEKIVQIDYMSSATARPQVLEQLTYDSLIQLPLRTSVPRYWALKSVDAQTQTIQLDGYPTATDFILKISYLELADTLEAADEPAFPESFHDVLVHGAMAIEYMKMEKPQLAALSQRNYENRLSDLRMFIAKSAFQNIVQGRDQAQPYWPWRNRTSAY